MKKLFAFAAGFAMAAAMSAQVTFTCTAGAKYGQGEGIQKLFDGNTGTKYCGDANDGVYALVTASEPVYVWGYDWTTGNDNAENGGQGYRLCKRWTVYGTNDESVASNADAEGWVTLSNLGRNDFIQKNNKYTQRFFCDKGTSTTAYKYFKIVLNEGNGNIIQFSEFKFLYETKPVAEYNWYASSDNNSQKACDGKSNPKWEGNNLAGNWLTIKTSDGKPHAVKSYSFTTNDDGDWKDRAPKSWRIEGSYDGTNWVMLTQVVDDATIQNANHKTFEFSFPEDLPVSKFVYLRLHLDAMKGTGWTQVGEFHVTGTIDAADETYTVEDFTNEIKAYYTAMVNALQPYDPQTLGTDYPLYTEYKSLYDSLGQLLESAYTSGNYSSVLDALEKINVLEGLMDQYLAGENDIFIASSNCWGDSPAKNLIDGKETTKWGAHFANEDAEQYIIFRVKDAFAPYFYKLVTGGDTKSYTGRNWKTWSVYGTNFNSYSDVSNDVSKWTLLDERVDISEQYLPMENYYPAMFDFNKGVNEPYYYYMVVVKDSHKRGDGTQMSEMLLCTKEEFETMRQPMVDAFKDFDATRAVEPEYADELASFIEKYEELKTTSDAVKLTLLYNECVALYIVLEGSMNYVEMNETTPVVDGVYQLSSASQLVLFSKCINGGKSDLKAALAADIALTESDMPAPIGSVDNPFKGSFDGQGFAISGFVFEDEEANNVGFFGYTSGATIIRVLLKNAKVVGHDNAGGLVGNAQNTTIEMCAVVDSYVEGWDHVAAIAANAAGGTKIRNNFSDADIASRQYQAGGLVGTVVSVIVENNLFAGTVTNAEGDASGLVSRIDDDADPLPIFRNNMVAAPYITGRNTYSIINPCGRQGTYSNNYTLKSTVYSTGEKVLNQKDDANGMQVSDEQATCKSFYAETLGWDMTSVWKFVKAGQYPVLVYMDYGFPAQEVSVSETGYATFVAEAELEIPEGVEVFAVQLNGEKAHLEPIENAIPAGEAVVVKAAANTYEFAYAVEYAEKVSGNELKAAVADVVADGTQYVLADGAEGIGFYQVEPGSTIVAGKGYLEISAANGVKGFYGFESGDATGISDIDANVDANAVIYNLSGQRIQKAQKGINIVNGKKLLK